MSTFSPCMPTACLIALGAGRRLVRMSEAEETTDRSAQNTLDARLLQRTADGDRAAFGELYDRFSRPLYATALRILNDAKEAEDIVQDTFIALWEKAGEFAVSRGTAFGWAVTLTRNRAIDRVRMRRRRTELLDQAAPEDLGYGGGSGPNSADQASLSEQSTAVRSAVAALPTEQQQALELAFFSGLTQQEIAARLNEPLGTIKARIRRGLLKLRANLSSRP
jgi:RNA polymerase sigma-70 factor (ECF subfamily)